MKKVKVVLQHALKTRDDKGNTKYLPAGAEVELSEEDLAANPGVGIPVAEVKAAAKEAAKDAK